MADGALPFAPGRRAFLITARPEIDVLARVLAPFAVQHARIVAAELCDQGGRIEIRLDVTGLDPTRADTLAERLRAMPSVIEVGQVWRPVRSAAGGFQTFL
jgi:hypothetical protein